MKMRAHDCALLFRLIGVYTTQKRKTSIYVIHLA